MLESYLALKDTNAQLAASHATAIQERNDLQRQLYQQNHVAAIAKWAVDTSVEKGARPKPDILKYLSDVSWQHGQDFNEPLRGETLAWIVKAYRARCERAHSKFEPLVKQWYFLRPTRRNNNQRHLPTRHATDEADRLSSHGRWSSSTLDGDKNDEEDEEDEDENDGEKGRRRTTTHKKDNNGR
ncbi:hypothetical protein GQ607_003437 [Colletotrichum asianum]|uniref:Uncharacterized protein n=1 Tax=Colletotrichum asianum TaxID=702518 RepID=A0A8H3WK37_9PEZI|nr:hypothetical protein GQ607_003437 [Colletotrichum asianum]